MEGKIFSERHGFNQHVEPEITIRNEGNSELNGVIVQLALDCGMQIKNLRSLICNLLMKRKDENNYGYDYVYNEVICLIDNAQWYEVYDIIEKINAELNSNDFMQRINKYFIKHGIGWQLVNGIIKTRAPEALEQIISQSLNLLDNSNIGYQTTYKELHKAISNLSIRPEADITGAIQHSMAALECLMRDLTGDTKSTLGVILNKDNKNAKTIPTPLNKAIEYLWGYASNHGRHLNEGRNPTYEEAQLTVGICATTITYLLTKNIKHVNNIGTSTIDNIPF
ncbi:MAG: hypothetical protein K0R14_1141 [Burkholderiales bacterium]|jgi:hypothetical protein|nr:hypothetical protein [Burkholderiales bacterium]